ncbi:autotransporter outer membrane beta-barrel domain-containing protein [Komagataeibacter melaceti]|uniref:hypothetical protein n=1 Tax=Komagataeibacter melaceti TaxID=2766577 RepID=UPI001F4EF8A9|nr:hypothetical protein [Komagataeibacter melaceti]
MDRQIVYPAQIPLDSDQLNAQRNAYVGLGQLAAMAYGWSTVAASGFACTPGAGLAVTVAPGSLLAPGVVDGTAYGTLAAVASALVRQYVSRDPATLTVPGAGATYTVYVTPATVDTDDTVLPFYNAANPSVTYAGSDNSGKTAPTVRQDAAQLGIGTSAPNGAYPLWIITVPAAATSITTDMIVQADGAPFYDTIPQLQADKQDALGFTPVQQGGGINQVAGKVFLGRDTTYPGLRYSYVNGGGNTVTGGYLLSTYGTELNAAYGQLGDLSQDSGDRLVYQSYDMNGSYYTAALLSDVTGEAAARAAADASLMAGFAGGISANGDKRLYGGHLDGGSGKVAISWDGGQADIAFASDVTAEAAARAAADATLVSGTNSMDTSAGDMQIFSLHYSGGMSRPAVGYGPNGASQTYAAVALYSDVTNETIRATNAEAGLVSGTFEMASGDSQGIGLHWSTALGAAMFAYGTVSASTVIQLASHSEVVAETTRATNVEATLVSGTSGVVAANGDKRGNALHLNGSSGNMSAVYDGGSGDLAWAADLTAEVTRATNVEASLISGTSGVVAANGDKRGDALHLNGSSGNMSAVYDGGSGDLAWAADLPTAGSLPDTDDYQNCRWTIINGVMTLSFVALGTGAGGSANNSVVFPKAFAAGTTPVVSPTIDREPGSSGEGVSRFVTLAGSDDPSSPVSNTGFQFQPTFTTGNGTNTSSKAYRLQVVAIGNAP